MLVKDRHHCHCPNLADEESELNNVTDRKGLVSVRDGSQSYSRLALQPEHQLTAQYRDCPTIPVDVITICYLSPQTLGSQ